MQAHSPVSDLLFFTAMLAIGIAMAFIGWLLPHDVTSVAFGVAAMIVSGRWLSAPFQRFLGKFNINT